MNVDIYGTKVVGLAFLINGTIAKLDSTRAEEEEISSNNGSTIHEAPNFDELGLHEDMRSVKVVLEGTYIKEGVEFPVSVILRDGDNPAEIAAAYCSKMPDVDNCTSLVRAQLDVRLNEAR